MTWLISKALMQDYENSLSLQAQEAESLVATCSDGEQFAPSSGNPIPQAYLSLDKMKKFSRLSRFGMTFKPLTESRGEELLTWYLAGFHAKTSAQPEKAQESKGHAAECGNTWRGLLAKFDPDSSSWKTAQCSLLADLEQSLETFPKWGSMRNGELFQRQTWERPTCGSVSGLSPDGVTTFHTPNTSGLDGGSNSRKALKARQAMWPTPTATESSGGGKKEYAELAVNGVRRESGAVRSLKLRDAVKMWPTPCTRDHKGAGVNSKPRDSLDYAVERGVTKSKKFPAADGGQLNPTWVEWLMGWPLGHTELKPLETDKFQQWRQQHSEFLAGG